MSTPNRFQTLVADAKTRVTEIDVAEYQRRLADPGSARPLLIDVRDGDEVAALGLPAGAVHLSRGRLEGQIESAVPDLGTPIVCICAGGNRSALAAESLQRMGYTNVASFIGGFGAWTKAGLPVSK